MIAVANERGNEQRARNTFAFRLDQPESGVKRVPTGVNEANYGLILISQLAMRPRYTVPPAPTIASNLRRYRLNVEFDLEKQKIQKKKKLIKKQKRNLRIFYKKKKYIYVYV